MVHCELSKVPTNVIQSKERLFEVQWDPALHGDRPSTEYFCNRHKAILLGLNDGACHLNSLTL